MHTCVSSGSPQTRPCVSLALWLCHEMSLKWLHWCSSTHQKRAMYTHCRKPWTCNAYKEYTSMSMLNTSTQLQLTHEFANHHCHTVDDTQNVLFEGPNYSGKQPQIIRDLWYSSLLYHSLTFCLSSLLIFLATYKLNTDTHHYSVHMYTYSFIWCTQNHPCTEVINPSPYQFMSRRRWSSWDSSSTDWYHLQPRNRLPEACTCMTRQQHQTLTAASHPFNALLLASEKEQDSDKSRELLLEL